MKKNAIYFYEVKQGHESDWVNKKDAIRMMEEYADLNPAPMIDFNPLTITILVMLFVAGVFLGTALSFSF